MSWFESVSTEMFQALVRDAMQEDLDQVKNIAVNVQTDLTIIKSNLAAVTNEQALLKKEFDGVKERLTK